MAPSSADVAPAILARDRRALARVLTWLEAGDARGHLDAVRARTDRTPAYIVGLTGSPGAGKSTLANQLVANLRSSDQTVAVLAIDPSSPISGGALLGDRIRMDQHTGDPGVYIRSLANRGQLGGLSLAVPSALVALDAFGFDWIIVETVGVGQVEVDIVAQADTTVVVVNPGWGDHVQASKAGLLEVADIFAVNKADRPGAKDTIGELNLALDLSRKTAWRPPIVACVAETGDGVDTVQKAIDDHRQHLVSSGGIEERRRLRRLRNLRSAIDRLTAQHVDRWLDDANSPVAHVVSAVASGDTDPLAGAREIVRAALAVSAD